MEFRHIRSFLSVAETLHFGRSSQGTIRRDLAFMALAFRKERDSSARTQRESIRHVCARVRSGIP